MRTMFYKEKQSSITDKIHKVEAFLVNLITAHPDTILVSSYVNKNSARYYLKRENGRRVIFIGVTDLPKYDVGTYKVGYPLDSYEYRNLDMFNMLSLKSLTALSNYIKKYL